MKFIVTGGLGFIGSNICERLVRDGHNVLIVDRLDFHAGNKIRNVSSCASGILNIIDAEEFKRKMEIFVHLYDGVFHQGACADTTCNDVAYMLNNNSTFSIDLIDECARQNRNIVYASSAAVYGSSREFREIPENEHPLNVYGMSKLLVDNHVRTSKVPRKSNVIGLRYFNVYGKNEEHKGKMASMVHQLIKSAKQTQSVSIFSPGDQRRDFIHVDDVVDINLHFMRGGVQARETGVYNVGTGVSTRFDKLASIIKDSSGRSTEIRYFDMPGDIRKFYQDYTKADTDAITKAGVNGRFISVLNGVGNLYEMS